MEKKKSIVLFLAIFVVFGCFFAAKEVVASLSENVWGWAWSENIGWIKFNNCTSTLLSSCVGPDFGVNIEPSGIFSGYAWSENIGWISFNQADLAGCPSGACNASVATNTSGWPVSGWARAFGPYDASDNDLLLYYKLNDSANPTEDSSPNGNDGNLINSPSWISGKYGGALNFNGSSNYVSAINNNDSLNNVSGEITIEAWIKIDASKATAMKIVSKKDVYNSDNGGYFLAYQLSNQQLYFGGGGARISNATMTIPTDNTWHHIAGVIQASSTWTGYGANFYLDGNPVTPSDGDNGALDGASSSTFPFYVGKTSTSTGNQDYFKGGIDEVRVYKRALSASEIWADYLGDLVLYYKFDENGGMTTYDSSKYGNNGLRTNDPIWTNPGKYGSDLKFNVNDNYVEALNAAAPSLNISGDITMEAWVNIDPSYFTSGQKAMEIICKKNKGTDEGGYCLSYNTLNNTLVVGGGGSDLAFANPAGNLIGWHHVAATISGSTVMVYIDGNYVLPYDNITTPAAPSIYPVRIGSESQPGGGNYFRGEIDEVRIYNRALSASEIMADYLFDPYNNYGGWNGWIKLRGTWTPGVSINTSTSPAEFKGWAWGGDDSSSTAVIGWISFNDKDYDGSPGPYDYQVVTSFTPPSSNLPVALNPAVTGQAYCNISSGVGLVGFEWLYGHPAGDPQSQYEIQIDDDVAFGSPSVDCTTSQSVASSSKGTTSVRVEESPSTNCSTADREIGYNSTYYWRVRVLSSGSPDWSDWATGAPFSTPANPYPWPNFSSFPSTPTLGTQVEFSDAGSDCHGSPCTSYSWTFGSGSNPSSASGNYATTTYNTTGIKSVTLTVANNVGSCNIAKNITIGTAFPKWREIPPIIFLQKMLAMILNYII